MVKWDLLKARENEVVDELKKAKGPLGGEVPSWWIDRLLILLYRGKHRRRKLFEVGGGGQSLFPPK